MQYQKIHHHYAMYFHCRFETLFLSARRDVICYFHQLQKDVHEHVFNQNSPCSLRLYTNENRSAFIPLCM